jgi:MFS family permease
VMQLLTLSNWGYLSDHLGNRIVLVTTAFVIPVLPMLWIFSDNFWYLLAVQGAAGLAWGGFSLSASNYLYDLRPAGGELATFAAVQAILTGTAIFTGALIGGMMAVDLPLNFDFGGIGISFESTLYGVFAISAMLRLGVALWFTPHVAEIRLSNDATVNEVIYRFARFNPVSGVVIDIIGAVRRKSDRMNNLDREPPKPP